MASVGGALHYFLVVKIKPKFLHLFSEKEVKQVVIYRTEE